MSSGLLDVIASNEIDVEELCIGEDVSGSCCCCCCCCACLGCDVSQK